MKLSIGKRWNPIAMGGLAAADEFLIFADESVRMMNYEEERMYFLVTLGYHIASTINFLIIDMTKADYAGGFNMLAHHLATCLLCTGGFCMNYI